MSRPLGNGTGNADERGTEGSVRGRQEAEWDSLATIDPLWAILSDPAKRSGRWESDAFMATGEQDVARLLGIAARSGLPLEHGHALDFGCGIGRLTRALAGRFGEAVGVDVSREMVRQAEAATADFHNLSFVHDTSPNLGRLGSTTFDLVLSLYVLQHLPGVAAVAGTLEALAARVAPGGVLIVQLPAPLPLRNRLQLRRRIYAVLRRLGVDDAVLHRRFGLSPIRMHGLAQHSARAILQAHGLTILEVQTDVFAGTSMVSNVYFATR